MSHMSKQATISELYRIVEKTDSCGTGYVDKSRAAKIIRRNAATLSTLAERECNGVIGHDGFPKWDDGDQARADKRRDTAETAIVDALKAAIPSPWFDRLTVEFQGDPRGAPVLVHIDGQERFACFY